MLSYPDPPLTDGTVRVRPWEERDLPCVEAAATDPRIPVGTSVPADFSDERGLAFIRRQWFRATGGQGVSLAIEEVSAGTGSAVGLVVLLLRPQPAVAGIGYWVIPGARGHGYAARAVALVSRWALEETFVRRVEALAEPGNVASRRTLERCGFREEGLLRSYLRGEVDAVIYSLLASDLTT